MMLSRSARSDRRVGESADSRIPEVTVAGSDSHRDDELASSAPASSPDNLIKDLSLEVTSADQDAIVGSKSGNKAEYLIVKMNDVFISSVFTSAQDTGLGPA